MSLLSRFATLASVPAPTIKYVGGYVEGFAGTTSNKTISLTSLSGGLASSPSANDIVVVYFANSSEVDDNLVVSGYTEVTEIRGTFVDAYANLVVAYKFMGVTPDTSVTLTGGTLSGQNGGCIGISVWRGVNQTTPLDVTSTTATGGDFPGTRPNPPAITTVTSGAVIIAGGVGSTDSFSSFSNYSSSDLDGFRSTQGVTSGSGNDCYLGIGFKRLQVGTFNPAIFTGGPGGISASVSLASVTMALRPA
jgi:hypothetical protein